MHGCKLRVLLSTPCSILIPVLKPASLNLHLSLSNPLTFGKSDKDRIGVKRSCEGSLKRQKERLVTAKLLCNGSVIGSSSIPRHFEVNRVCR